MYKVMKSFSLLLFIFCSLPLPAQNLRVPTLSPITEVKQEIGLTEIGLSYSRPSAKGREVFGALVPYGEIWRTGANASTQLTFKEDVSVGGKPLPKGTYALYTIPGKESWTIIIHKNTGLRSLAGDAYKAENDAFRFEVKPLVNPIFVETFTITFTDLTTEGCNLQLAWANTLVKFPITVDVDRRIQEQITALAAEPGKMTANDYFRAAEYYLHNGKDLAQAETWIKTALQQDQKNPRFGLLYAKIQVGQGKPDAALRTVNEAHQWAVDAKNANYEEQTRLFRESIEQ